MDFQRILRIFCSTLFFFNMVTRSHCMLHRKSQDSTSAITCSTESTAAQMDNFQASGDIYGPHLSFTCLGYFFLLTLFFYLTWLSSGNGGVPYQSSSSRRTRFVTANPMRKPHDYFTNTHQVKVGARSACIFLSLLTFAAEDRELTQDSDYSFPLTSTSTTSASLFSFSQVDSSAELLQGSPWCATAEVPQYLPEFQDHGSSHSGDTGEYIFTSGQETPKGNNNNNATRIPQHTMPMENTWSTAHLPVSDARSHAMARIDSTASGSSSLSQTSSISNIDNSYGPVHGLHQGSLHSAGLMQNLSPCQMSDGVGSPIFWPGYGLEIGLGTECPLAISDIHPLNVSPSQVTLQPEPMHETSSPNSWDGFSSSISRTSSPATIDETWLGGPVNDGSPAGLVNNSMRYVSMCNPQHFEHEVLTNYSHSPDSQHLVLSGDVQGALNAMNAGMPLSTIFKPRSATEGEDPRRDARYKEAVKGEDGLWHCPWEGQECCNHKPEKLKCNYE